MNNIFEFGEIDDPLEVIDRIAETDKISIERIISTGQTTPEGEWLVQKKSEFVLLLTGKAGLEFKSGKAFELLPGDHLLIPCGIEHRVTHTQKKPPTIWLAVHY